jgi:hypothetical protein
MSELIERPNFLPPVEADKVVKGLEDAQDLQLLNYVKIIQGSAKGEFADKYDKGDIIVVPEMKLIAKKKEPFHFYPVFFYREYQLQNPYGVDPFIVEKTRDKDSPIAVKARSRNAADREIPHPTVEGKFQTYREALCFIILLDDHNEGLENCPIVMQFSGGEFTRGVSFKNKIMTRGTEYMCANRFACHIDTHKNSENEWMGFEVYNPESQPFCESEAQYKSYVKLYDDLNEAFKEGGVQVYEDPVVSSDDPTDFDEKF